MDVVELAFDQSLFTAEVLLRTAHRYTAEYYVDVRAESGVLRVYLKPKRDDLDSVGLESRFRNDALDDRLRAAVAIQTGELQAALVHAALEKSQLRVKSGS